MALSTITLIVNPGDVSGNPITKGSAVITPTSILTDPTDHVLATEAPIAVTFNKFAPPQVELYPTDNEDLSPSGWAYTITFFGFTGAPQPYSFELLSTGGDTQYLSDLTEVFDPVTMQGYLPLPGGTPTDRTVPYATGSGENSVWTPIPLITVSPSAPSDPQTGDIWIEVT